MKKIRILAVSGSLRGRSFNTALLKAAQKLVSGETEIVFSSPLDRLPFFNADLDTENPPESVRTWRGELKSADAVLIASPEYAFAIPGVLKNALDWIVSSAELYGKPVGLINASPGYGGASKVQEMLVQLLKVLTARLNDECLLRVASVNKKINAEGSITDLKTEEELRIYLRNLEKFSRDSAESAFLK
ncbi:NADPH-dependent FMN reductase [Leptospira wolffii]|uniref:NADPH-dependent FMN reductase n=1 Tax=Leptospira wolffii TaxID=409998 RepID=UPI0002D5BFEC|nr:NADPH-dependent FMN reductase [Leptospira wolffii]EPG64476.1 flavin reductase [Leptospira wolffii serovar Khorat str. Khorat-H2]